ncbi:MULTISPECIES: ABC transporter ATP-binding protein/permease [Alphaproteobacteria]|uniref:ABC transporter permease n=2 Tax=Alphaproteobacteria TaxID=28211 RepID=A0A512HK55_9HYPH|nr:MULTISPECIES: ABC transporter ATP-binding protein/permease [Alphaproteobacteria]GEO85833.1 ABC transporter permease [Ciceribacter naphthalenivorans]GLR21689.1 ABC transporter permease [Ciceribacter naphthalenivorans]GLT04545.1 ABC transporter permease [Sphingomonas psychrolutea]
MFNTVPDTPAPASAPAHQATPAELSLRRQLVISGSSFWASPLRNRILLLATALLAIILLTAYGQILLNSWNAPFYNSLERRDLNAFIAELWNFGKIAGFLLVLNVTQTWLNQMTALYMREGLARQVVDEWLADRRAYRLSLSSPLGVNPDQRLHEDTRKLAEMTTSLSIGLVQATILLVSFIGVLWKLSSDFVFHYRDMSFSIPGYMVWGAILYAGLASLFSQIIGWNLTRLNATRYANEAELRFSLMRASENLEAIALARGEDTERRHIHEKLDAVVTSIRRLAMALTNLTWVTAGFGWLATIVPILIASPAYFAGTMSFGGLMMAAAAFNQVHSALRWYVSNYDSIADWKANLMRVSALRAALIDMGEQPVDGGITVVSGEPDRLTLEGLAIASRVEGNCEQDGFRLKEKDPTILAGNHVMINGDQGVNRKLLFNAIAGLWPYGTGRILLPKEDDILFVPQLEYLPGGKLRSVLAYPLASAGFTDDAMIAALERVGLARIAGRLDESARWDRLLDKDEQMALSFAGLILRKPRWIVFNDVLEGLESDTVTRLSGVLTELSGSTLIYIGRSGAFYDTLSPSLLHLERTRCEPQEETEKVTN